jgi:hypothetical protein
LYRQDRGEAHHLKQQQHKQQNKAKQSEEKHVQSQSDIPTRSTVEQQQLFGRPIPNVPAFYGRIAAASLCPFLGDGCAANRTIRILVAATTSTSDQL